MSVHIQHTSNLTYAPHLKAVEPIHPSPHDREYHQDGYVALYLDDDRRLRISLSPAECRDLAAKLCAAAEQSRHLNAEHDCAAEAAFAGVPA